MTVPLDQFVKQLEDSGILDGDTLKDFIPPKASPKDAEELAKELVRRKKLTKFQAEHFYRGNGRSLVLGNYVLMEKIGAGGMGQVFKAEHRRMHRIVAVKILPASTMKDPATLARFEREVMAAAKISHPNIVAAFDADCANGVHFLVMELVEGVDLSALIKKKGPLSVEKALNYILQASMGLEAAHRKGIVHRDIKPANLLLSVDETVKILDMGLARFSENGDGPPQAELTNAGTIMGTIDYMAPEQALDTKSADARADIYALGCSLYYLLTGNATYKGDTLMKKLLAHREEPVPSLREARQDVSQQLESVFRKMVAKKVEERYQTTTELISDLERLTTASATEAGRKQSMVSSLDNTFSSDFQLRQPEEPTVLSATQTKLLSPVPGNHKRKFAVVGGALAGMAILAAGIIISLQTKDGTLVVEVDQPNAMVQVFDSEGKVEITQKGVEGSVSISVDPGKHRLKVTKDGFTVYGQDFKIESGQTLPITAKLVPVEDQAMPVTSRPAVEIPLASPVTLGPKKPLYFETTEYAQWEREVHGMPADEQVEAVRKKLMELNPGFDGKLMDSNGEGSFRIQNGAVVEFRFFTDQVTDISPVRAMKGLRFLTCVGSEAGKGQLTDLSPIKGMRLSRLLIDFTQVSDLSPLQGMNLAYFSCGSTFIKDLSPLTGMALTELRMSLTNVTDLSPLKSMPLTVLDIRNTPVTNLNPLADLSIQSLYLSFRSNHDATLFRSLHSLQTINDNNVEEFCRKVEAYQTEAKRPLAFQSPDFDQWMERVVGLPAEKQLEEVSRKLVELNPNFDGKLRGPHSVPHPVVVNDTVTELTVITDNVTDFSPIRALRNINWLSVSGSGVGKGRLVSLLPLQGLPLAFLECYYTQVSDLTPIKEMKLSHLNASSTFVSDLSPLQKMPLKMLYLTGTPVDNLSPLAGTPLSFLHCQNSFVSDLSPLKGMPLNELVCSRCAWDLRPVRELPLKNLTFYNFLPDRDTDILRSISTLEKFNSKPVAEFWKEVEAKKLPPVP